MTREWQPGDVAAVQCSDGEWRQASYFEPTYDQPCWVFHNNGRRRVNESAARPLVVIDPDSPEDAKRLLIALEGHLDGLNEVDGYSIQEAQDALRSLVAPSKPDEPMVRYAVVIVSGGAEWLRAGDDPEPWNRIGSTRWRCWDGIDAVKVLSPGVTEDES